MGFKDRRTLIVQALRFEHFREVSIDLWGEKGKLSFTQEGLISLFFKKAKHRYSENNYEVESDKPISKLMDQSDALYNLYSNLSNAIINKEKLGSNLQNALKVMKIINSLEQSFSNNDEKIWINE